MPATAILNKFVVLLDNLVGVKKLRPAMRAQLRTEQILAVNDMTPSMIAGSGLISLPIVLLTIGTPAYPSLVVWAVIHITLLCICFRAWARSLERKEIVQISDRAVRRLILNTLFMGANWAIAPAFLLPLESGGIKLAAGATITAVACGGGFALSAFPPAAVAFVVPMTIGSLIGILRFELPWHSVVLGVMMISFAVIVLAQSVRQARIFMKNILLRARLREQGDVIRLLLKEFDPKSSDWLWDFDRGGRMTQVSARFSSAAQLAPEKLTGRDFFAFLREASPENEPVLAKLSQDIARFATFNDIDIKLENGGDERWWRLAGQPTYDELGDYAGYIGTTADITRQRQAEKTINYLAHHDSLTGLINRSKFNENLKTCVERLGRSTSPFALLFMDLDLFKSVNDSHGHIVGDKLLVQVSERIRAVVPKTGLVARLGGDEFAVLIEVPCPTREAAGLATRLIEEVNKPYEIDHDVISIGISVGISIAVGAETPPDQLLRDADLALYSAKAEGGGIYRFFEPQMDVDVRERRILQLELRRAVQDGEFILHYQPIISTETNRATGIEALVRWNHPINGLIPPGKFIPIAEQGGIIDQIGDWTIREACRAATAWPEDIVVAVNLSAKHFQMSDIVTVVRNALIETRLPPGRLELEITESLLIERPDEVLAKLAAIKALGVSIAMDDFGTGYSSLSYLLKFQFDKIKIDQSFIAASSEDIVARDILRTITSLGKVLNLSITAEGVETQAQADFLREIACHQLQGFYFAEPMKESDLAGYFQTQAGQTAKHRATVLRSV